MQAGYFTSAGKFAAKHIARWDGAIWTPLGSGTNDGVWDIAYHEGTLWVDGDFTSAGNKRTLDVAKVDLLKPVQIVDKSIVNLAQKATVTFRMVNSALMVSGGGVDDEIRIYSLDWRCIRYGKVVVSVNMEVLSQQMVLVRVKREKTVVASAKVMVK